MPGMFNAPCCATCKHGFLLHGDEPAAPEKQQWSCLHHDMRLPDWLPAWRNQLVICQAWHHYNDSKPHIGSVYEWLVQAYPDPGLLYSYVDEYTPGTNAVIAIADLPDRDPSS